MSFWKIISDLLVTWLTAGGKYLSVSVFWWKRKFYFLVKTARLRALLLSLAKKWSNATSYRKRLWNKTSFEPNSFNGLNRLNLEEKIISKCPHEPVTCILPAGVFALARGMCSCVCVYAPARNSSRFSSEKEIVHFRSRNANRLWMRSSGNTSVQFHSRKIIKNILAGNITQA